VIEVARQHYPDRDTMMRDLAELVADQLRAAHASKQRATLAVPGGTTPGPFLRALSEADLAWPEIAVLLTDERLVPETSARSNTRLVREALLQNAAVHAGLVHFHAAGSRLEPVLDALRHRVDAVLPVDVLVLGMGADMHTASLFPGAPELAAAVSEDAPSLVEIHPPGQPEARLTLSAPVLRRAGVIHILIAGADKAAALDQALTDGPVAEAPIRVALTANCPVTVHYAD
jgi:6-phosphogluconolactonase